ncbi:MAG: hypothetical protein ACI835_005668 [Planctomycetota bacterium]|jgi:hypothetical protein
MTSLTSFMGNISESLVELDIVVPIEIHVSGSLPCHKPANHLINYTPVPDVRNHKHLDQLSTTS